MKYITAYFPTLIALFLSFSMSSCLPKNEPQEFLAPSLNFGLLVIDDAGQNLLGGGKGQLDISNIAVTLQNKKVGVYTEQEFKALVRSGNIRPKSAPSLLANDKADSPSKTSNPILYGAYVQDIAVPHQPNLPLKPGPFQRLMIGQYDGEKSYRDELIIIDWGDGGPRTEISFTYTIKRENDKVTISNVIHLDGKKIDDQDPKQLFHGHIVVTRS